MDEGTRLAIARLSHPGTPQRPYPIEEYDPYYTKENNWGHILLDPTDKDVVLV
jgi:hypothetical protein